MQKIIPFKKEIIFKNTIEEILSISMDNHLEIENSTVKGNFLISGEYESLQRKEPFNFDIPYLGYLDENYNTENAKVDVDDFYYEINEPNKLSIFIDICVDKLQEKPLIDLDIEREDNMLENIMDEKEGKLQEIKEVKEDVVEINEESENIIFSNMNSSIDESYMTYKVYIVREGDTIEAILEKYEISHEQLFKYNVINELNIGDKLIIPHEKN